MDVWIDVNHRRGLLFRERALVVVFVFWAFVVARRAGVLVFEDAFVIFFLVFVAFVLASSVNAAWAAASLAIATR